MIEDVAQGECTPSCKGSGGRGASAKRANFDSRFVSREGAKNAKEKACDGFSVPSREKFSSATEFRPLCVLCVLCVRNIFAPFGECTRGQGAAHEGDRDQSEVFARKIFAPNCGHPRFRGKKMLWRWSAAFFARVCVKLGRLSGQMRARTKTRRRRESAILRAFPPSLQPVL